MSARDVMAARITAAFGPTLGQSIPLAIEEALTAAGWRLVGPDEVDPVTVERLAKFIDNFDNPPMYDGIVVEIAAAIRAIASGGKQ